MTQPTRSMRNMGMSEPGEKKKSVKGKVFISKGGREERCQREEGRWQTETNCVNLEVEGAHGWI